MRRFLSAILIAFVCCCSMATAGTRILSYPGENPRSIDQNGIARFERLDKGTVRRDELGTVCATGAYANLSVVPNGGMYVAVQPTTTNTMGSLYQMGADDVNPIPQGSWSSSLASDNTQICIHGMQSGPSGSVGPITAPGTGSNQYFLLEAQIQSVDNNSQSLLFINSNNSSSYQNVNTNRVDSIVYQLKAGAVNGSAPSADSGWIGIANILVPGGVSSITSGMITALSAFGGFIGNGTNVTLNGLTLNGAGAGCLNTNSSGVVSVASCTGGLGTVNGTSPITATTVSGTATISCTTCVTSVSGSGNIASTGGTAPTLSLTGVLSYSNLPTTVAQTGVNNNFSVTQNFQSAVLATPLAISSGGTGSSTQNFVDLSSAQVIGGAKRFTSTITAGASAPTLTTGDIDANRSSTTGAMVIGGATESSALDFNISNANATTLTCNGVGCTASLAINGLVSSGLAYGNFDYQLNSGCTSGHTGIGAASASAVAGVTASTFEVACVGTSTLFSIDNSGDVGIAGNLYATNAYYSSRREWKQDISSLRGVDALDVLSRADWARFRFKPKFGDPSIVHYGFIANDTPSELAGPNNNHFDSESVSTYAALAALQLRDQVAMLRIAVGVLVLWCIGLSIVVLKIARRRA